MRPPLLPRLLVPRLPFFYGWIVLACICLAGFARQGPAVATLSVFVVPMTGAFGWSRTEIAGAVSLGFAIPTSTVLDVTEQLLTDGRARHSFLGVSTGRLTPAIRQELRVPVENGALVRGVEPGSPAAAAGVRPGDVIVGLGGEQVDSVEELLGALRRTAPDSRQPLVVMRGRDKVDLVVTIGSRGG